MSVGDSSRTIGFARPGRALTSVMIALGAIWLMFAVAVNWAGAGENVFLLFCGNTERILHGEIWRLFTAPLMHVPSGTLSHILSAMFGLFFLAPRLEQHWGSARMLRFLFASSLIAYGFQMLGEIVLPASLSSRLVREYWFGSFPALEAIGIAWALSFRGETVRLWFVIPASSNALLAFIIGMSVLSVVALNGGPEGLLSPFGGMFAGWLLGGGTPSPLRKAWLRLRLAQLDREAARGTRSAAQRRRDGKLRVIEGGKGRAGSDHGEGPGGGRMLH